MPNIFISYSSLDKKFANQLRKDLVALGHTVWLDSVEIKVGDFIAQKIQKGISSADYLVVLLSRHSVASGWVEREWQAKYGDEVEKGNVAVLPVLIEECEIPTLLKSKRWADFRTSYAVGIIDLVGRIGDSRKADLEPFDEVLRGINQMVANIKESKAQANLILAFERASAFVAGAVAQRLRIQEVLVLNRSRDQGLPETSQTSGELRIGTGISIDSKWLNSTVPIIVKYSIFSGQNLSAGLDFLKRQGVGSVPPVFTLYISKIGRQRWPHAKWVYDHRDVESALALLPWISGDYDFI